MSGFDKPIAPPGGARVHDIGKRYSGGKSHAD
jgi:hypothetical protein